MQLEYFQSCSNRYHCKSRLLLGSLKELNCMLYNNYYRSYLLNYWMQKPLLQRRVWSIEDYNLVNFKWFHIPQLVHHCLLVCIREPHTRILYTLHACKNEFFVWNKLYEHLLEKPDPPFHFVKFQSQKHRTVHKHHHHGWFSNRKVNSYTFCKRLINQFTFPTWQEDR